MDLQNKTKIIISDILPLSVIHTTVTYIIFIQLSYSYNYNNWHRSSDIIIAEWQLKLGATQPEIKGAVYSYMQV